MGVGGYNYLALRYLVRSYVTRPTTIKAITEIPAKTPRPMGSTDSFFPGKVKDSFVAEACSAAAADAEAADSLAAAATVSEAETDMVASVVGAGVGTIEADTAETP